MGNPFGTLATARAALLLSGSTYVSFFFGLIVSAIIARAVGPEDFGRYAYVVWITGVLASIANNGLNTTGIRFVSESLGRDSEEGAKSVHGWLRRRQYWCLAATALSFLAAIPWIVPADWNRPVAVFGFVVLISMIAKALYLFDISIAKGYGQYSVEAFSTIAVSAGNLVCVVVLFGLRASLSAYLTLFTVAGAAYAALAWRMLRMRRLTPTPQGLDPSVAPRLKNHLLWTVMLTVAAAIGNKSTETYLLSVYAGPAQVGFFAIAATLTRGSVELMSSGLNGVLMPLMGHAFGAGQTARVNSILVNAVRYFYFAGLLLAGLGFLWADPFISLAYGAQYGPATQAFQIMALVAGLTLSQGAFGALLSTTDHQRIRALFALLSVVLSIGAAVLLVPRYGLAGAVIAHCSSSTLIFVLISAGIVHAFSVSLPWRELARLTLAAAVAAAATAGFLWSGKDLLHQFVGGVLYAVLFIVASFLFRAWKETDLSVLAPLASRYPELLGRLLPAMALWLRR
ncbi:MAG: polysaccharide biosynthesis C-terminal domain-containing protein [Caldimonas sp.]